MRFVTHAQACLGVLAPPDGHSGGAGRSLMDHAKEELPVTAAAIGPVSMAATSPLLRRAGCRRNTDIGMIRQPTSGSVIHPLSGRFARGDSCAMNDIQSKQHPSQMPAPSGREGRARCKAAPLALCLLALMMFGAARSHAWPRPGMWTATRQGSEQWHLMGQCLESSQLRFGNQRGRHRLHQRRRVRVVRNLHVVFGMDVAARLRRERRMFIR